MDSLKSIPKTIIKSSSFFLELINSSPIGNNTIRKLNKGLRISLLNKIQQLEEIHALFDKSELDKIFKIDLPNPDSIELDLDENSILRKSMNYRIKYDLPLDMLIKVDRMSMSNSLEVRNPCLDSDLFDASCCIPDRFLRNKRLG